MFQDNIDLWDKFKIFLPSQKQKMELPKKRKPEILGENPQEPKRIRSINRDTKTSSNQQMITILKKVELSLNIDSTTLCGERRMD